MASASDAAVVSGSQRLPEVMDAARFFYASDVGRNSIEMLLQAVVLFAAGAIGMLLPLLAMTSGSKKAAMFIAYGNAFSGGVMLAAGLIHMLGEALSAYRDSPRVPLIACFVGVMVPFALEKGGLLIFLLRQNDPKPGDSSLIAGHGLLDTSGDQPTYHTSSGSPRSREHSPRGPQAVPGRNACVMPAVVSTQLQVRLDFLREASNQTIDVVDHAPTVISKHSNHSEMLTEEDPMFVSTHGSAMRRTRHTHFSLSWMLLTIILVFHSLLAGFALGIQNRSSTPALFLALILHKLFESLAMGMASTQTANATLFMRNTQFWVYCLAAPFGVMLGQAFSQSSDAPSSSTRGLITALASGSFLYISLVEITQEEFIDESKRIKKFLAFITGSLAIILFV